MLRSVKIPCHENCVFAPTVVLDWKKRHIEWSGKYNMSSKELFCLHITMFFLMTAWSEFRHPSHLSHRSQLLVREMKHSGVCGDRREVNNYGYLRWVKRKGVSPSENKKWDDVVPFLLAFSAFSVIRLGLEPKTPTLKVLCSTSWASGSPFALSLKSECKGIKKCLNVQIFCLLFLFFLSFFFALPIFCKP